MVRNVSTGQTPQQTAGDAAITLLPGGVSAVRYRHVTVINEGNQPGFISIDGGAVWHRLPVGPSTVTFNDVEWGANSLMAQRVQHTTDMTGLYASAWGQKY